MIRQLVARFVLITLSFLAIGIPLFAHHGTAGVYDYTHRITTKATVTQYIWANPHVQIYFTLKDFGICPRFVLPDARVLGGSRCSLGGGGGVLVSSLPIKPGYTTVEVQMPKDDDKRPPSEQEQ